MKTHAVAALLFAAFPVPDQTVAVRVPLDTAEERQELRKLTLCFAQIRPRWARNMLSFPYLSEGQARVAAEMVSGPDNCLGRNEVAVAFRTSSVVGFAAEHFLQADLAKIAPARLGDALNWVKPMNVTEDFALCLAARNPSAAIALAFSAPGSAVETSAAGEVATSLPQCTKQGERLDVDVQALRALVATALYRGVAAAVGSHSN